MASTGVGESQAQTTIVLRPAAGDIRLTVFKGGDARTRERDVSYTGTYTSGESVPTEDVPRRVRMFSRGAGFSSRPGTLEQGQDWDGYAESSNACLRFGYICPSGEQTASTPTSSYGAIRKIISFNGDLFYIFANAIAYRVGGLPSNALTLLVDSATTAVNLGGDFANDAAVWGGSLRVATLCGHAGAASHMFLTISVGAPYTVTYGTSATYAGFNMQLLETVFWEYQGVGATRLVGKSAGYSFRYMIVPLGDPYDVANWGPLTAVGDGSYQIRDMVSSHDTVWFLLRNGLYAVTDKNAANGGENLTPYWADQISDNDARLVVYYWNQWVVASTPLGVDLVDVNSWQVKDAPRPAHITYGRPNNTLLTGYYTAFCSDSGWLVGAMRGTPTSPGTSGRAQVLYGTARRRESVAAGMTEIDWFSEIGPLTAGRDINCMAVHTYATTGRPYLWLGMNDGSGNPYLVAVELFQGTSPLADTLHRYNTLADVTLTDEHWAARSATKGALRGELAPQNCGSGRKVDVYAVAGAGAAFPGSPNATVDTNVESATFNLTSVRGSTIRAKLVLTSTATVPVVVHEFGLKANLGFPLRNRGTWLVLLSDETEGDLPSFETPRTVEAALKALCESVEAVTVLDDEGVSRTVVLKNVLPWRKIDRSSNDLGIRQKDRVIEVAWQEIA